MNVNPKATGKYQLLDRLAREDFAALERDILERGVLIPIELDEDGNVLDGHHRLMICQRHGITNYPTIVRSGLTEQEKRTHARRMNLARRHLTRNQKRSLIEAELRESPGSSDRQIGRNLGVDHKTVGAVREKLESAGEIPHLDATQGKDGKQYQRVRRSPTPSADGQLTSLINDLQSMKRRMLQLPQFRNRDRKRQMIRKKIDDLIGLLNDKEEA